MILPNAHVPESTQEKAFEKEDLAKKVRPLHRLPHTLDHLADSSPSAVLQGSEWRSPAFALV